MPRVTVEEPELNWTLSPGVRGLVLLLFQDITPHCLGSVVMPEGTLLLLVSVCPEGRTGSIPGFQVPQLPEHQALCTLGCTPERI